MFRAMPIHPDQGWISNLEMATSNRFGFNLRLPDTLLTMSRKVVTVRNICNAWPYIFWWTVDDRGFMRPRRIQPQDLDHHEGLRHEAVPRSETSDTRTDVSSFWDADCFELREIWSLEIYQRRRIGRLVKCNSRDEFCAWPFWRT